MIAGMTPSQKGAETKMRNELIASMPQRKECPHCHKNRQIKFFGIRVEHDTDRNPVRALLQSRCTPCRRPSKKPENILAEAAQA